jgi:hypothetical protein
LALDWHTVKALEMQYMKAQLARAGTPGPLVIGIDEIAIHQASGTGPDIGDEHQSGRLVRGKRENRRSQRLCRAGESGTQPYVLDRQYETNARNVARQQAALAGVRLANLVNAALK